MELAGVSTVTAPFRLPRRAVNTHKGSYGRVLMIAGSRGMSGAAILAGSAALRGGAGLVQVACPADIQAVVASGNPCYLTSGIPQTTESTYHEASLDSLMRPLGEADVVAIGPGLGNRPDVANLVKAVLTTAPDQPTILDADALNVLSPLKDAFPDRQAPLILTPHPGEMARLCGKSIAEIQANRVAVALELARRVGVILVLKGHHTLVTDGERLYENQTGNPGLATGGSGDVLTGLIAALVAGGLPAFEATTLGVWIHGRAGDLAAAARSQTAMIASDLLEYLPEVFLELEKA